MFNSSQSQLTFTDELDLISQPNEFHSQFNDFTLPSQTQASQSDHLSSQVSKCTRGYFSIAANSAKM